MDGFLISSFQLNHSNLIKACCIRINYCKFQRDDISPMCVIQVIQPCHRPFTLQKSKKKNLKEDVLGMTQNCI